MLHKKTIRRTKKIPRSADPKWLQRAFQTATLITWSNRSFGKLKFWKSGLFQNVFLFWNRSKRTHPKRLSIFLTILLKISEAHTRVETLYPCSSMGVRNNYFCNKQRQRTNNHEAESFVHWSFDNSRWLRNDYCRRKLSIASYL